MPGYSDLPHWNAFLNGTSAVLLMAGFVFIRRKNVRMHRRLMLAGLAASVLFLISYLVYHAQVGSVRFQGQGWIRPLYFAVLLSHTLLAAAVVPFALITVWQALAGRFERHRRIARWTLPIWVYVSVTGVAVYLMLYHH